MKNMQERLPAQRGGVRATEINEVFHSPTEKEYFGLFNDILLATEISYLCLTST